MADVFVLMEAFGDDLSLSGVYTTLERAKAGVVGVPSLRPSIEWTESVPGKVWVDDLH